jgi:hypothetical protein
MADFTIGGGIPVNTGNLDNIQTSNVQKKGNIQNQDQIGQGTLSQTGGVPDVPTGLGATAIISFSVIFASSSFAPKRSGDVEITLAEVSATLKDTREKTSLESVNANQEKVRTSQKEQQSKLAERKEKIEKSIADDKKSAIAKFFSRLFEALALVFTYVMAGLAMATGVGAGMGALLIAGAVAMTIMFANSVVKDATGLGIAGNIAKSMGASEEAIAKADKVFGEAMMGITVALSVLTIGAQLAPAVMKAVAKAMAAIAVKAFDSATKTAGSGFDIGMKMAEKALSLAEKGSNVAKYVQGVAEGIKESVRTMQTVARVGGAVVEIGSGTTGVISSTITYGQQKREAEAKQLEAEGQELDALMKTLESLIDMALDMLMNANQISGEMIDSAMQSLNDRGASLSKNMFAG